MAKRCLRADLVACGLLFAGLLIALSILSFDSADPPANTVHPPNNVANNLLGPAGAWVTRTLLETLGVAVYVLLASWFVLVVLLFLRRGLLTWSLRAAGWFVLIPCAAVSADYVDVDFPAGAVSGSGGTVGAWLHAWLETTFYPAGCYLILGGCLLLSRGGDTQTNRAD